jgi:mannose-6-phosphate isomerase
MQTVLYPLKFKPIFKDKIWGGRKIKEVLGMDYGPLPNCGEVWLLSGIWDEQSEIANGDFEGDEINDLVETFMGDLVGESVFDKYGEQFPLLLKIIDANDKLSIQVHPDNELARQRGMENGKTEMWYILDAEPGACIYSGFKKTLDPEEYKRMVQDGTVVEALAKHEVHAGDVFYIPAGRVHAICGGIMLAEIQQSSDVTYRIFDYNRPGLDGKPRELHTEFAARALNYKVERKYRTDYAVRSDKANLIMESKYFSARVTEVEHEFHRNLLKYDSFIITMCLKGDCIIRVRETGDEVVVKEGYSCLIPAAVADYDIRPVDGYCKVLDAFIDNQRGGLVNKIHRLFHKNKY